MIYILYRIYYYLFIDNSFIIILFVAGDGGGIYELLQRY